MGALPEEYKQYAIEMSQICKAYSLGQMPLDKFISCAIKFNDWISTIDNLRNQDCLCECKYPVELNGLCVKCKKQIVDKIS